MIGMGENMKCVRFAKQPNYIKDFIDLPKKLYSRETNMEDPDTMEDLLLGEHPLSKYFRLDKFLVYAKGTAVGRFAITTYPGDDTAYFGFFECVKNRKIAKFLFGQAENFCRKKGYKRLLGPVDASFWLKYRLKINRFDAAPYTGEPYNKPYYYRLFLDNGFRVKEHYTSNDYRAIDESYVNEKYEARYREFVGKSYRIKSPKPEDFDKILDAVYDMITELYSDFPVYKQVSREDFREIFGNYKMIMDMSMTKIAYCQGKPVGFYISVPDYGNSVYHLAPWNLPMLFYRKNHPTRYVMLYMGVKKEHQGLGKAIVYSVMKELMQNGRPSIGALARDGKVTQNYAAEDITNVYEYVLLEKEL